MVLVYSGRRIDPEGAAARFPLANAPRVRQDAERVLRELRPATVVGSAACGADLLVLDAARALGIRRRIVLPFDRAAFRRTSVSDRPGDWGPRFDALVQDAAARGDLVELDLDAGAEGAYLAANDAIYREAERLTAESGDTCQVLVLWNGASRGEGDVTEAFLNEARRRGLVVIEIDTASSGRRSPQSIQEAT